MYKLLLFVFLGVSVFGSELKWKSYKEIHFMMQDKILSKPVLAFIASTGCIFCEKMKKDINADEEFKKFLLDNYELVYINQSEDFTPADLYSPQTPTFYVLNPKNLSFLVSEPAVGAVPLIEMKGWLSNILYQYRMK
jgi:hypothetical protein